MKAVVIHQYGGPEVLRLEDCPDPVVGGGEVLVRVAAAGINPVDTLERAGLLKDIKAITFPAVLGWDLAGTVLSVAPDVEDISVGDRVFAWAYHTYAERCVVKAELLAKIPNGIDIVGAAALPLVTITGNQLVSVAGEVTAGQMVLVSGAFGGVGRSAVFAAKDRGAVVIAGVRRAQLEAAKDLGADRVLAIAKQDSKTLLHMARAVASGNCPSRSIADCRSGTLPRRMQPLRRA